MCNLVLLFQFYVESLILCAFTLVINDCLSLGVQWLCELSFWMLNPKWLLFDDGCWWWLLLVMVVPVGCFWCCTALVIFEDDSFRWFLVKILFGDSRCFLLLVPDVKCWSVCRLGALPPLPGRGLLQLPLNHSLLMISAVSPRRTAGNTTTTLLIQPPAPNPASLAPGE